MDESQVKEYLLQTDQEFRKLAEEHKSFERQLQELQQKPHLNHQDQVHETILKKKKLALKDRMQMLISRYQGEHATH